MSKHKTLKPFQSAVIRAPIVKIVDGKEDVQGTFAVGIRVQLPQGEHFFYSTKHGTWTRHRPTAVVTNRTGTNIYREDKRISKFRNDAELRKQLGHAKKPFNVVKTVIKLRDKCL